MLFLVRNKLQKLQYLIRKGKRSQQKSPIWKEVYFFQKVKSLYFDEHHLKSYYVMKMSIIQCLQTFNE